MTSVQVFHRHPFLKKLYNVPVVANFISRWQLSKFSTIWNLEEPDIQRLKASVHLASDARENGLHAARLCYLLRQKHSIDAYARRGASLWADELYKRVESLGDDDLVMGELAKAITEPPK